MDEANRALKKTFIIEIARKIQNLRIEEVNDQMRGMLLSTNRRNKELFSQYNIGIMVLLKWWGDPKALSDNYCKEEEEREKKEKEEKDR